MNEENCTENLTVGDLLEHLRDLISDNDREQVAINLRKADVLRRYDLDWNDAFFRVRRSRGGLISPTPVLYHIRRV